VIFYRSLAKVVEKYVHKGDKLFVEGKIRTRSYDDKKGVRRTVTEIYADNLELLTPKKQVQEPENPQQGPTASEPLPALEKENEMPF
jgi:single-strand DNA-binding protein